jgi:hypothetical protein
MNKLNALKSRNYFLVLFYNSVVYYQISNLRLGGKQLKQIEHVIIVHNLVSIWTSYKSIIQALDKRI